MAHYELDTTYIESLTKRELEVLELLASGASNQEIAAALVVEVTTVKWYNAQIYDKLQVKNRKEAIIRAQTLGILKPNSSNPYQKQQHNLPADTLPFIGRAKEMQQLIHQLTDEHYRLITILGPGGMGKTRLSIEVGRQLLAYFRDGVYFVPLTPVTSTEQIVTFLADIIGFKFHSDKEPQQQLMEHFQKQHILLIIDNFEHLLDSTELLADILQSASKVKMLITSREKLNLVGEVVHILSGLSSPFEDVTKAVAEYDAVKLFIETARRAGIEVDDDEMPIVAHICQLLGGMPLGILLAAAWVDTLAIAAIEAEIQVGLGILEGKLRGAPSRHHSINAAFDTSWKRLSPQEQAVFIRLSVFRHGFTREAAQKITGASVRDLQRLVRTSFIQLLPSGRYAVHELMRQYGEEKLEASGELDAVRDKHAQFFAELITPLSHTSWSTVTTELLELIDPDFENIRAAWLFQAEHKNILELRRFLDGLWLFFDQYSRSQEGIELFEPLMNVFRDDNDDVTLFRGQLLARLAWFYSDTGHHQKSIAMGKQALQIVEAFASMEDILMIHVGLSLAYIFIHKQAEAIEYSTKGFELVQKSPDSKWMIPLQSRMGAWYQEWGRYEEAQHLIEALPDHKFRLFYTTHSLRQLGEYAQAEELIPAAQKNFNYHRIDKLSWYGTLIKWATEDGNYDKAWMYVQHGLQYGDDGAYAWGTFYILREILRLLIAESNYTRATELLSLIEHHPASIDRVKAQVSTFKDILKARLSIKEFEAGWEQGKLLDLGDVITEYMER